MSGGAGGSSGGRRPPVLTRTVVRHRQPGGGTRGQGGASADQRLRPNTTPVTAQTHPGWSGAPAAEPAPRTAHSARGVAPRGTPRPVGTRRRPSSAGERYNLMAVLTDPCSSAPVPGAASASAVTGGGLDGCCDESIHDVSVDSAWDLSPPRERTGPHGDAAGAATSTLSRSTSSSSRRTDSRSRSSGSSRVSSVASASGRRGSAGSRSTGGGSGLAVAGVPLPPPRRRSTQQRHPSAGPGRRSHGHQVVKARPAPAASGRTSAGSGRRNPPRKPEPADGGAAPAAAAAPAPAALHTPPQPQLSPPEPPAPLSSLAAAPAPAAASAPSPTMVSPGARPLPVVRRRVMVGRGGFGTVYRGVDELTNAMVAIKEVTVSAGEQDSMVREVDVMRRLPQNPHIVRYLGAEVDESRGGGRAADGAAAAQGPPVQVVLIYMEYVSGGSLQQILRESGAFSEPVAARYVRQVVLGLAFLHSERIAHRDIKCANLLVTSEGQVKLADFGHAKELVRTMADTVAGTACFMAPEVVKGTGHDESSDIWSLGCTIIEMLQGKPPFSQFSTPWAALFHVAGLTEWPDEELPPGASAPAREFLAACLVPDPKGRAPAAQLLDYQWVRGAEPVPA
eukprot:TRINITY_DN43820_c0_g1_i1.p1 TRINITY_DN43820_c0_g1~~TRINITY_DN43820_c0_g1_i1.p1  ORF type:complete len:661 (+),score=137.54 TRINITY_DN43820_c0_g1_i1:123-1985(+)